MLLKRASGSSRSASVSSSAWNQGAIGWGECVAGAGPWYSYETVQTAWYVLSDFLIPILFDRVIETPGDVFDTMHIVRGHRMAKAGLEMALWDLSANREGVSLATFLGGTRFSRI